MSQLPSSKLPRQMPSVPASTMTSVIVAVVVIAALYFGREVLVPIALALLLSFVLAPLVRFLQRLYVPRIAAVLIVALFAFSTIFGLGALMVSQVTQLAEQLPVYQTTLREKIQSLRGAAAGKGTLERASEVLQDLSKEIDRPRSGPAVPSLGQRERHSGRSLAARSWRSPGAVRPDRSVAASADDDRHRGHLPHLHPHAAAGSAESAGAPRGGSRSAAYDRGAGRCRAAPQPLVPDAACAQRRLRARDRNRSLADWSSERAALGHAGDDHALRPLYRRADLGDLPAGSGGRGWPGLGHGDGDRGSVLDHRADRRPRDRTAGVSVKAPDYHRLRSLRRLRSGPGCGDRSAWFWRRR